MRFDAIKVLLAGLMIVLMPSYVKSQGLYAREYTEENPLIYEDAWDLWPYVFLNEHGEPVGFNIDLLKELFHDLNIPYVIKLKPTSEALNDMKDGNSDLMLRLAATFHDDYAHYGKEAVQLFTHSVISPKSKPLVIRKLEDLGKHKVIVHAGSLSHRMMVDRGWEDKCIPIGDMKEAIQLVSSKDEGQIVWNTLSLKWLMKKFQTNTLQLSPIDMPHGEYKFMSNDTVLLNKLDSAYLRLCESDRIQPILNKWFYPDRVESGIPGWLVYVVAGIALLVFLMVYYVISLQLRERKMTRLIARQNKRLALILRTTKVKVWLYEVQSKRFVWMDANGEMDSTEHSLEQFVKDYRKDTLPKLREALDDVAFGEKENRVVELTSDEKHDSREYVITISVFRRTKKGAPKVIVGMMDDQTERLQSHRKSKDDMLRYQTIFSTSMVDMTYYNEKGILTDINQKACETFNCNREDILAEKVSFNNALEDLGMTTEEFEGSYTTHIIKAKENPNLSDSIKFTKDVYYEQQLIPVYDSNNHLSAIFGSGRDMSEFVDSYHQLKKSVKKLKRAALDITEYINNINYSLHVGGVRLVTYSPVSHMLTIYKEMNVVQLKLTQSHCLALVDESSKRLATRMLNNMDMRSTAPVDVDIKTTVRIPGRLKLSLQFHFVPSYDDKGEIVNYFGLCRDMSQEKAAEEELEREKSKAQEVESVKNVFLRNMSHEIRTPISTVVGFAELFVEDHDTEDEDNFISEIKKNAKYLLKLVNEILFLSRLDAHMIEFKKSPIDFAFTFEGHCQIGWAKLMKENVNYVVENPYEHLTVDIDDSKLGYVIEQVTENAARFTDSGSIRARYDYIGDKLLITIEDTGIGIEKERQLHIFDRFNIISNNQGTGLGMPICNELVQQMGGSIYINSAASKGTTVWVVIPCKAILVEKKLRTD